MPIFCLWWAVTADQPRLEEWYEAQYIRVALCCIISLYLVQLLWVYRLNGFSRWAVYSVMSKCATLFVLTRLHLSSTASSISYLNRAVAATALLWSQRTSGSQGIYQEHLSFCVARCCCHRFVTDRSSQTCYRFMFILFLIGLQKFYCMSISSTVVYFLCTSCIFNKMK